jgi:hypothetical protein
MDGQRSGSSLHADLSTLQKELREMHREARMAAAQKSDQSSSDQGGMVIRGK